MKEIWSIYCFDHISFVSGPIWLVLGSFSTLWVCAGIPVTSTTSAMVGIDIES
jgi:hypothetical protein